MGKKAFESLFGKEKFGRVRCYGRTITPTTLKKNQEIDALKRKHSIERNDMIKKFEGFEVVMKFMLKQNTDLDENDIEEMMSQALDNEISAVAPRSSAATHVPDDDDDDEVYIGPSKIVKYFIHTFINWKKIMSKFVDFFFYLFAG